MPLENNPDFLLLSPDTSGAGPSQAILIDQVRQLQKRLHLKPYQSAYQVALIIEGQRLTLPAQHSLLKLLEEPPLSSLIILTAPSKEMLLPTIVSRCQHLLLSPSPPEGPKSAAGLSLRQIIEFSPGEKILLAQKFTLDKPTAISFCTEQIGLWRKLATQPEIDRFTLNKIGLALRLLQQSLLYLAANVHPKLVIENLLLSYPKLSKI